jgi:hypothetical protein
MKALYWVGGGSEGYEHSQENSEVGMTSELELVGSPGPLRLRS